jgi:hypothetical protein
VTRLTQIQATPEETELLHRAVTRLQRLLDASDKFVQEVVAPPVPDSAISRAYRDDEREAFDLAYGLLFTAEDHLRTILIIVYAGTLPCFSLFTLLRTAAEAVVRARYLLDPTLTHAQRLGRGLNERLVNLYEQDKVMSDAERAGTAAEEMVAAHRAHFCERMSRLEYRASRVGLPVLRETRKDGSTGRITGLGETMRSEWDLFNEFLGVGATVFRFLSGYVHARQWVQFPGHRAQPSDDPRVSLVPTELNVEVFVGLLTEVTTLYDQNVAHWMYLAGFPADVWRLAKGE